MINLSRDSLFLWNSHWLTNNHPYRNVQFSSMYRCLLCTKSSVLFTWDLKCYLQSYLNIVLQRNIHIEGNMTKWHLRNGVICVTTDQWRNEGRVLGGSNPPKFRSFDKAEPNSQLRGKYIRNNLTKIRVSLIFWVASWKGLPASFHPHSGIFSVQGMTWRKHSERSVNQRH
jgi:hypothetical protein